MDFTGKLGNRYEKQIGKMSISPIDPGVYDFGWMVTRSNGRPDNDSLSFNDVEFELNRANVGRAHLFDDQAARESPVFPNHFQDDGAGDEVFFDSVQSALAGSGN
jgi:hypothetical protein